MIRREMSGERWHVHSRMPGTCYGTSTDRDMADDLLEVTREDGLDVVVVESDVGWEDCIYRPRRARVLYGSLGA